MPDNGPIEETHVNRREFMKRAAAAGAAFAAPAEVIARADTPQQPVAAPAVQDAEVLTEGRSGSDFMVDLIKSLGFDTSAPIRARASVACRSRSSTTAATRSPSS